MVRRICHYLSLGLIAVAGVLVLSWVVVCMLLWRYSTPQPSDGEFLNTTLGGGILLGYCFDDWVAVSYLYHPHGIDSTVPWVRQIYGVHGWGWLEVESVPTRPPPEGPSGGYGNVNLGLRFHAFRMLLLSVLLFIIAVIPVAFRRGWIRRSQRRGFEPVVHD